MMDNPTPDKNDHSKRDAETLLVLGAFMVVLALPVMVATVWAGHGFSQAVNFCSGAVLFAVGGGMMYKGWRDFQRQA
ncbi:MAG: DUF2157 domain-containing protein [Candidatus Hydrogenedens sp.]|nr:DUF2157 domain-containing protein [Candidatus Hydrogenedens sp.]